MKRLAFLSMVLAAVALAGCESPPALHPRMVELSESDAFVWDTLLKTGRDQDEK